MVTGRKAFSRKPLGTGFVASAVRWFLGLSGLYVLYASGTFFGLDDDSWACQPARHGSGIHNGGIVASRSAGLIRGGGSPPDRRASCTNADTIRKSGRATDVSSRSPLARCMVSDRGSAPTFLVSGRAIRSAPKCVLPTHRIVESARFWVSSAIAIFTFLSGVAGGLTEPSHWSGGFPGERIDDGVAMLASPCSCPFAFRSC